MPPPLKIPPGFKSFGNYNTEKEKEREKERDGRQEAETSLEDTPRTRIAWQLWGEMANETIAVERPTKAYKISSVLSTGGLSAQQREYRLAED